MVTSIRQNVEPALLPDFRNLGVILRSLLLVNLLAILAALARCGTNWRKFPDEFTTLAAFVEPALLLFLLVLMSLARMLSRMPYRTGAGIVLLTGMLSGAVVSYCMIPLLETAVAIPVLLAVNSLWAVLVAAGVLLYFYFRRRAISPAVSEARLMALTARIRPHFLFNSLNAVLGVIRLDPVRAERALEELSDLFRVLMADNRSLVSLADELSLCRQYLALEDLRLGDRLQVRWETEFAPGDALVPPLMLQPLLENAVYHGIEPSAEMEHISIKMTRSGDQLRMHIDNPYLGDGKHAGNRMALDNIRERLALFFDLEARLTTEVKDGRFNVDIYLPYRQRVKQ